jgi:hypothetical protein
MEFLKAVGGFLKEAVAAGQTQPELAPLLGEMLMFAVRSFKAGRPIEAAFERFIQQMSQPQQPKPNPEAMKAQAAAQAAEAKAQSAERAAEIKAASDERIARIEAAAQQQTDMVRQQAETAQHNAKVEMEARFEEMKAHYAAIDSQRNETFERWKAELEAATKIEAANISSKAKVNDAATATATNEIATEVKQ